MKKFKFMLLLAAMFIVFAAVFTACEKDDEEDMFIQEVNLKASSQMSDIDAGMTHNRLVRELYTNIDWGLPKELIINKFKENLETINFPELEGLEISRDSFNQITYLIIKKVKENQKNGGYGFSYTYSNTKVYLDKLAGVVESIDSKSTVTNLQKKISRIKHIVNSSNLNQEEKFIVSTTADIMSSSIKLWLPFEMGGDNLLDIIDNSKDMSPETKKSIAAVVCSDGAAFEVGVGYGLAVILASGGTATPPTIAGILVGTAASSAFTAIWEIFS